MAASMCRSLIKANKLRNFLCLNRPERFSTYPTRDGEADDEITFGSTNDMVEDESYKPANNFAALFRNSAFAQLGHLKNKRVIGTVETVRGDDLYIDFGAKFYCVCPRPAKNAEMYKKGTHVRLLLNDMEMTSSFLGSERHISLLEADCTLLGLQSVRLKKIQPEESASEKNQHMESLSEQSHPEVNLGETTVNVESETSVKDKGTITLAKIKEVSTRKKGSS